MSRFFALLVMSFTLGCGTDPAYEEEAPVIIVDSGTTGSPSTNGTPANNMTPSNNVEEQWEDDPVSTVTCDDLGCTEEYCEDGCQRVADCGLFETTAERDECFSYCRSLDITFDAEYSDANCPTITARVYDCAARLTCARLEELIADNVANPACEKYVEEEIDACFYVEPTAPPQTLVVDFLGAIVAPGKVSGEPWDGIGGVSEEDFSTFVSLAAQLAGLKLVPGSSQVIGRMLAIVNGATSAPDPYGAIDWDVGNGWMRGDDLYEMGDTYTPIWTLSSYQLEENISARWNLILVDADLTDDDAIASVVLTTSQMLDAAATGGDVWLATGDAQMPAVHVSATLR